MKPCLDKECLECGTPIKAKCESRLIRTKYCSRSCRQKYRLTKGDQQETLKHFLIAAKLVPGESKRPKNMKSCKHCQSLYLPTGTKQRWCTACCPTKKYRLILQRYQLDKVAYDSLMASNSGLCNICNKRASTDVDHCHITNKVRGALCSPCNMALNRLDRPGWLERAKEYTHSNT